MNSIQFIINRIEKKRFLWGVLIFIIFHMLSVAVEAMPLTPPPDSSQLIIFDATRIRMDLSSVHSGILEDVGITPVDFAPFDGTLTNNNYVNFQTINGIVSGLASSKVDNSVIPTDITAAMSSIFHTDVNPVGIVAYNYSRTKSYALAQHLLVEDNGNYYDPPQGSNLESPYEDHYVVAFSPYMNIVGNQVSFSFNPSMFYTNLDIRSISFDYDGQGYRAVNLNGTTVFNKTYQQGGTVELKLKIILNDSQSTELFSHSKVSVITSRSLTSSLSLNYYETIESDYTYEGFRPKARMSVKYANGSSFSKPLIFAEGFDPFSDPANLFDEDTTGVGINSIRLVLNKMSQAALNYDIVYVDWLDSAAPIEANADILKKVINWVNEQNHSGVKSILVGESMGGLISRYALRTMERAGLEHNVKCYVSYDSPHYGVNIPIGYLYLAQHLYDELDINQNIYFYDLLFRIVGLLTNNTNFNSAIIYLNELSSLQTAPSVKQMLVNYIDSNCILDRTKYLQFQDTLNVLGFPQGDLGSGIINLAVSNGGGNHYVSASEPLLGIEGIAKNGLLSEVFLWPFFACLDIYDYGILGIGPGISSLGFLFRVNPVTSGGGLAFKSCSYHIKQHGLLQDQIHYYYNHEYSAPPNPLVFDDDAGSFYSIADTVHRNPNWYRWYIGGYDLQVDFNNRFMFVPTVSSLHYKNNLMSLESSDRKRDFVSYGLDMNDIPFDGYMFMRDTATYHTDEDSDIFIWIDKMLGLSIQSSPDTLLTGYQFQLSGLSALSPEPYTVTWSVADASVAQINSSGIITSVIGGTTEAYADITYLGGHYRLKRQFSLAEIPFPGFPDYVLHQVAAPVFGEGDFSGDYSIYAQSSAQMSSTFTPYMQIHWGVKQNTGDAIQWTTTPYNFFHNYCGNFSCNFPSTATARRVYFYVTFRNQTSLTYSVFCREPVSLVLLDGEGNLYTEDMDEPFVQVKSDGGEYYHFTCLGKNLVYNHWPTWAEFCQDMLTEESFVNMVKTAKPWGTEDLVLIPYSYYMDSEDDVEYGYLTVKYDSTL